MVPRPHRVVGGGLWLLLSVGGVGCAGAPGAAKGGGRLGAAEVEKVSPASARGGQKGGQAISPMAVSEARWVPPVENAEATIVDRQAQLHFLAGSLRATSGVGGQITTAPQLLPASKSIWPVELPERLGGGFLFFAVGQGTSVFKSKTWLGPLSPLTRFEGTLEAVEVGFSSVLVKTIDWFALKPEDGVLTDVLGLPRATGYEQIAVVDAWFGAVQVPLEGILATFDAGQTWLPLGISGAMRLRREGNRVAFDADDKSYRLDAEGHLSERAAPKPGDSGDEADMGDELDFDAEPSVNRGAASPLTGDAPLAAAVAWGFAETQDTAVVAQNSELLRVRLTTGEVEKVKHQAFEGELCSPLSVEKSPGFVCTRGTDATLVYRLSPEFSLTPVASFRGTRRIASSGNGAFSISGGCQTGSLPEANTLCVRSVHGSLREVRLPGARGNEQAIGLADGRTAILIPPAGGRGGILRVFEGTSERQVTLKWPRLAPEVVRLVRHGVWLQGFWERAGEIAGWVVDNSGVIGVSLSLDGRVKLGEVKPAGNHPILSGKYALILQGDGTALESTDGGFSFNEIPLPMDERRLLTASGMRVGCSQVGCVLGDWLRIGWQGPLKLRNSLPPTLPRVAALPSPGGNRWRLSCKGPGVVGPRAIAGVQAPLADADPRRNVRSGPRSTGARDLWEPFWHLHPPKALGAGKSWQFNTDAEDIQVHAYLWNNGVWANNAAWQLYFADRFSVENGIRRTLESRAPWPDEAQAVQAFGGAVSAFGANWVAELEPSGSSGALLIKNPSSAQLFLFEAEGPLVALASGKDVKRLGGFVKLRNSSYVASATAREFSVFEVSGGDLKQRLRLTLGREALTQNLQLVRNLAGDQLGVWARAENGAWLVYPIDLERGRLLTPSMHTARALAPTPRICKYSEDGWLLVGRPDLLPHLEFEGRAAELRATLPEARVLMREDGICLQALAARADNSVVLRPEVLPKDLGVPLVVTDRRQGLRWGFSCEGAEP